MQKVMRGIRRTVKRATAKAAPALDEEVRAMVDAIDTDSVIGLRDWALLLVWASRAHFAARSFARCASSTWSATRRGSCC